MANTTAFKVEGTLTQTVANTDISVVRSTGVRTDLFEAVVPLYVRLDWVPSFLDGVATPFRIEGIVQGNQSLIEFENNVVCLSGVGYVPLTQTWERPLNVATLFDEDFTVTVRSNNLASFASLKYLIYYEIRAFTELEMIQTIANY